MVKDIYSGSVSSDPNDLVNVNGIIYFTADDGIHGVEVWKSDGTSNGTVLVQDIYPGVNTSDVNNLYVVGNKVFFRADDGTNGSELWVTQVSTDVSTINESSKTQVFPNPSKSQIFISSDININYSIYNISGQLVNQFITKDNMTVLDISNYPSGVYILKSDKEIVKFIKQ
jgi:ELWxxDGT repeat protein